jgi:hypothetical protein
VSGAAIGLTMPQLATLATLLSAAQAAESAAFLARDQSKAATTIYYNETDALAVFGAALVKTIKAFAEASEDPNIYAEALIPPPAPPTPLGPPETPTDVTAVLNTEGHVELAWKGTRTGGTSFIVERSVTPVGGSAGAYALIASVEERAFVDPAVPQGLASALYRVKAQRAGGTSVASDPAQVLFGTAGQGQQQSGLNLAA